MTNSTKKYFTIKEALTDIKNTLENGYDGHLFDLAMQVFNSDYYIVGSYEAQQALTQYDVWEAFEEIKEYENDHFGEVLTDLSNPENVAKQLYYLKGLEAIELIQGELEIFNDIWNEEVTEETAKSLIITINTLLDENLKTFLDDMKWVADYDSENVDDIECAVEIYNSVGEMEITEYKQRLDDDTIVLSDVSLSELIKYYLENGNSIQDICGLLSIQIYYCSDNGMYLVAQ